MENNPVLKAVSKETVRVRMPNDQILPEQSEGFVDTPEVQEVTERALMYLQVGYPVHLAGPAGTGKTTLAFHVAAQLGRPLVLINGDDEFGSSDLLGRDSGYRKMLLVDNFIHSVLKQEETMQTTWVDNRLTTACANGYTLIYDEFTRSRPEANNALLSVLEEKILNLPKLRRRGEGYMQVHSDFKAIFTSNPEEYAGVHKTQDALMDRLITISLGHFDRETEIEIAISKGGISRDDAETVVDIVRELREAGVSNHRPTIRATIAVSRVMGHTGARARLDDPRFLNICRDVFNLDTTKVSRGGEPLMLEMVEAAVQKFCAGQN